MRNPTANSNRHTHPIRAALPWWRTHRGPRAILGVFLILHAQFWTGGCGGISLPGGGSGLRIALTADHPISAALEETAFAGARELVIDPAAGAIRFVYTDARELTCRYEMVDGAATVTTVRAATAVGRVDLSFDTDGRLQRLADGDGREWQRPTSWPTLPDSEAAGFYERANADLLALARGLDPAPLADGSGGNGASGGGGSGGVTTDVDPLKIATASQLGPAQAAVLAVATVFTYSAGFLRALQVLFDILEALNQTVFAMDFAPAAAYVAGEGILSLDAADLDGDGDLDVAAAHYTTRAVSVLLNDGQGRLAPPVSYPLDWHPTAVRAADVNGDGRPDLLVADGGMRWLRGLGGGAFAAPETIAAFGDPVDSLAVGDFDADGRTDLAVTGLMEDGSDFRQYAAVALNSGGGFSSLALQATLGPELAAADSPRGAQLLAIADFDGDGFQDLAVAGCRCGVLTIYPGDGAGGFAEPFSTPSLPRPQSMVAADFDADGRTDLAVAARYSPERNTSRLMTLWGDASGAFAARRTVTLSRHASCLRAADLDGDGRLDLVAASNGIHWNSNAIGCLLSRGSRRFARDQWLPLGMEPSYAVIAADLDGDGDADLAAGQSPEIRVRLNQRIGG